MRVLILLFLALVTATPALSAGPEMLLTAFRGCVPGRETGDPVGYFSAWESSASVNCRTYYWHASFVDPMWTITLYADAAHTTQLATGSGEYGTVIVLNGTMQAAVATADGGDGQNFTLDGTVVFPSHASNYSDPFTGTDNTPLATHDANWVTMDTDHAVGNLTLYGNTARLTGAWALGGAVYNASSSGVSQISVQPVTGEVLKGPCVRAGGTNGTGYCVNLSQVTSGNWTRFILTRNSSFLTYSNPQAITVPTASAHTLRVEASGTGPVVVKAYIDNTPYITYTDSSGYLLGEHPGFIIEGNGNLANTAVDNWSDYAN